LEEKLEAKKAFESSRRRWEDNIKMDLKGIGGCGLVLSESE
jgi:hypothetical protein